MSFERSYNIESHEGIKLILIFGAKSLLLTWWVTYVDFFSVFQLSLHYPSHVSNVISCSSCFPEACLIVWKFSFNCALHLQACLLNDNTLSDLKLTHNDDTIMIYIMFEI